MMAGSDIENGLARSLTERFGYFAKRASTARRVASDSAAKVRSRIVACEYLTIELSVIRESNRSQPPIFRESNERRRTAVMRCSCVDVCGFVLLQGTPRHHRS